MSVDQQILRQRMLDEWGYPPQQVDGVIERIIALPEDILGSFEDWLTTGEMPRYPVYSGYSPSSINEKYRFAPPNVFLTLDWIRREPDEAMTALAEEYGHL